MAIPIFIHHELNSGNIKGLEYSDYPMVALRQAAKFNEEVIFFTDKESAKLWDKSVVTENFLDEKWDKFMISFKNLAINYSNSYVQVCFKRLFAFLAYAEKMGIEEFIVLDSDVMVYTNFSEETQWFVGMDCAAIIRENENLPVGPENNNMRWNVSLGTSYWKTTCLRQFINFCLDTYRNNISILRKKFEYHRRYGLEGGVCEMSLLYLFMKKNKNELKICNWAIERDGYLLCDAGLHTGENYQVDEYKYNSIIGMKCVSFSDSKPYFVKTSGEKIRVGCLHFAGGLKHFMYDYYRYNRLSYYHLVKTYTFGILNKCYRFMQIKYRWRKLK